MRNRVGAFLISVAVFSAIHGCATTEATTVQDEQDLGFTGVVTAGEVRGERSAQVLGVVESALLQKFPKAKWLTGQSLTADIMLDISVHSARVTESRSTQETRSCRRWSEPDKNAKGTLNRLISRNCLDWQIQQNPCITRNYELDVHIRVRQRSTDRVLVSDRKVSAGSDRACGNERPSLAALQADAESKLARWAVNLMRDPFAALASSSTQNLPNLSTAQNAGEQVTVEQQRQAAEADAARRKQQELEQELAEQARERERQTAEAEAVRRRQQELEQKLAADGERDKQAAEAEAARSKQQELEQRLATEAREREKQAAEVEAVRLRQKELEQRLTAEAREREKQTAEAEASKRRQQELETQLAAIQSQSNTRPSPQAAVIRNAHALVIGNAAYPGSMRLANPVNDANAISQKLRALGFTVTTVTDMNRQRLVQAMTQFRRSAASADLSLLFYSGHGVQIFGTNYILPTDVDQSDVAQATIQGVRLNEVVENFMPGKTKLVFLDACRDNPLMKTGDRGVSLGLAPVSVAQGTLISYATKDGQTASDGVGSRNSPFTTALLEHLGDPNDIAVVLRKVREKVMQATGGKQQPWEYGSLTGGELVLSAVRRP